MAARAVMVQATASHAGKSVVTAALCRLYARAGYRVAPFKAQNMSNNSWVTSQGGEIGRAQAFQAQAAGVEPDVDMNPILLKPEADTRAQVVCLGHPVDSMDVRGYHEYQRQAWRAVTEAFDRLRRRFDLIVLEGAGSPAEINLRDRDIVNMKMAAYAEAPVLLIGDIERGGVFASLIGTLALLEPEERGRIQGLLINKFRGDLGLLESGLERLERETGVPVLGVLPYVAGLPVDEEDAVALSGRGRQDPSAPIEVGVVHLPHISNATDFAALAGEPDVAVRYIASAGSFGRPDVVILPGSKSTVADLEWMRQQGIAGEVLSHRARGGWVIGVCGGYQMMGRTILDPEAVETPTAVTDGLGLLPVHTLFGGVKRLVRAEARCLLDGLEQAPVQGYEIHQGRTESQGARPAFRVIRLFDEPVDLLDGAATGIECFGTYLHGLFDHGGFRRAYFNRLREVKGLSALSPPGHDARIKDFDRLADWLVGGVPAHRLSQVVGLPLPERDG